MIGPIVNGLNPEAVLVTVGVAASCATLEPRILAAAAERMMHSDDDSERARALRSAEPQITDEPAPEP